MVLELNQIIKDAFLKCGYEYDTSVIISNRKELCDYQCDDTFKVSKLYSKSPIIIGEEVVTCINALENFNDYFKEVSFVKPGFINITLSDKFINEKINEMFKDENFNIKKQDVVLNYYLDYGGPNVAKPLHVGHLRTAILGESIKRIINFMGHNTLADVHLGDYGLQIGQVIYAVIKDKLKLDEITLDYLDYTYPYMSNLCKEDKDILNSCANITKELQDGNLEYQNIFKKIYEVSVNDIKRMYDYLDVNFDLWLGESDSYKYITDVTKLLNDKDLLVDSEGAKVVLVNEETDKKEIPPLIYQKSNGAYLYGTTDLASIYERVTKYNADHILYVVDDRQSLHFKQVFRAASKIFDRTEYKHLGYGTVNGTDGKPYKTRNGGAAKLDDLLNDVKKTFIEAKESNKDMSESDLNIIVNAIIKFADLQNNREKDYIFDLDKFSNVVGKTGPYILYTYLRMNKILKSESINIEKLNDLIYNVVDRDLRIKILQFENVLNSAFIECMPNYVAEYVYDLAVCTNSFYQSNHITGLTDLKKDEWLLLISYTNKLIKKLLELLVIQIPTQM